MCYYATLSALHRPQVLPSAETAAQPQCRAVQDVSRHKVREASREITRAAQALFHLQLARYLPTTGVTVLLPAIIIHLLDIKSPSSGTRDEARRGLATCMGVLELLRDNYAAADFATQLLGAAMRKAGIDATEPQNGTAAPNARAGPTPPPDSFTRASGAGAPPPPAGFWEGSKGTPNGMGDADAEMKLGNCVGGGEEGVFEEQFGALVDFGEGGSGAEGAEMLGGMQGTVLRKGRMLTLTGDTVEDIDIPPVASWTETLIPQDLDVAQEKVPELQYKPDETKITVSTSKRAQSPLQRRIDALNIDWNTVEIKQSWSNDAKYQNASRFEQRDPTVCDRLSP
ncbi:hypothetical protein V493_03288 [Pseudogymnoascus sp. VKM F-4281 (FW-2241)]|nr:hypothetical protein V493_03288 [Pseudogymnoascus sp. VKM F-4281 (FW-2241)]